MNNASEIRAWDKAKEQRAKSKEKREKRKGNKD